MENWNRKSAIFVKGAKVGVCPSFQNLMCPSISVYIHVLVLTASKGNNISDRVAQYFKDTLNVSH